MELSHSRRRLVERLRSSRHRSREGLYLVEGIRSASGALEAGAAIRFALLSPRLDTIGPGGRLRDGLLDGGVDVAEVEDSELAEISDTEAPQGVLLVCEEPPGTLDVLDGLLDGGKGADARGGPRGPKGADRVFSLLVTDGVQDPGNLGTLLRSARAFSVSGLLALDGTVDPWNPKVVRASAGASFHLPVVRAGWEEAERWLDDRGVALFGAAPHGDDVQDVRAEGRWALAVGNEGAGLRPGVAAASRPVAVSMPGGGESLNVGMAGSILLYVLGRREGSDA